MTSSIVHEIRQPLTSILANASSGIRLTQDPARVDQAPLREIFDDIQGVGRTAAAIVERLQALALVEAHAGRIWAEDAGGRGATFWLSLPIRGAGEGTD